MGREHVLKGPHEIGKYGEREEKKNHLGLKIGLAVGIPAAIIGGFFGYKALTNDNQVSTEEVQRALIPQDKKVEVVKKNYGQEAMSDLSSKGSEELYFGFTKEDYAKTINTRYKNRNVTPSQIFKIRKLSKEDKERVAELKRFPFKPMPFKKLMKAYGLSGNSGYRVSVSLSDGGVMSFYMFIKKDTGKLYPFVAK